MTSHVQDFVSVVKPGLALMSLVPRLMLVVPMSEIIFSMSSVAVSYTHLTLPTKA